MKMKTVLIFVATAAILTACGGHQESSHPKGAISKERSAAFKAMMPEFTSMGKMIKGDEAYQVDKFKQAAATFSQASQKPFTLFQSDKDGNGRAKAEVWQDTAKFKAEEEKFRKAVDELNNKAQTGNLEEIKAAYGEVGASCKSCHDAFRLPE